MKLGSVGGKKVHVCLWKEGDLPVVMINSLIYKITVFGSYALS